MSSVTFRQAVKGDISSLLQLLHQLFAIEEDFTFHPGKQQKGLEMMIDSPGAIIIVAESNGEIIGMATGQIVLSTAEGGPALLVEDVVVTRTWQRNGVGGDLLYAVGAWGEKQGARRMQLLVDRNNVPAKCFYENNQWTETALICLRKYHINRYEPGSN
jgi:GNAT superfamily N-acetyltransferase